MGSGLIRLAWRVPGLLLLGEFGSLSPTGRGKEEP